MSTLRWYFDVYTKSLKGNKQNQNDKKQLLLATENTSKDKFYDFKGHTQLTILVKYPKPLRS